MNVLRQAVVGLLWFLLCPGCLIAKNPIVPPGVYMADPEGHQWANGSMYVYVSRDESPDYYCSWRYDLLRSDNLRDWTIVENIFASKGPEDKVPYSDELLFAPDGAYRNGKYYLYYCQAGGRSEGVAVANTPEGPYSDGIEMKGLNQIDPAVFVDDDGQAYYYWGQFTAKGAKLKDNMVEIDHSSVVELLTEEEHFFHEGISMRKRNGIYYLVYSHLRKGRPTCIGYATSKSPLGPFKYGGVIVDNAGCDPESWNNHGSIAEFNGKWYVFYHRSTHGCRAMRKPCVEPIEFAEDGSIREVEMSSQGVDGPLDAFARIDAGLACYLWGNTRIEYDGRSSDYLTGIRDMDYAVYRKLDFGQGATKVEIELISGAGGRIDILADNTWSAPVGRVEVPAGNGETVKVSCDLKPLKGVKTLILQFHTESGATKTFSVKNFCFKK